MAEAEIAIVPAGATFEQYPYLARLHEDDLVALIAGVVFDRERGGNAHRAASLAVDDALLIIDEVHRRRRKSDNRR